jgi:ubiquinone/menaquinone biosynthesis C-methylase UbiE
MSDTKGQNLSSGFSDVDQADDLSYHIHYLDTLNTLDLARSYKRSTLDPFQMQQGDYCLDVGCGTGDDSRELAQRVGRGGRIVGMDNSKLMISEALRRHGEEDLPIAYCIGDTHEIGFADEVFHICRADRVFQHLEHPRRALSEMVRVLRSGGQILIAEPDYETLIVDSADQPLTRKLLNFRCDKMIRNGWIGRKLPALFDEFGLTDISVNPQALVATDYVTANFLFRFEQAVTLAQKIGVIETDEGFAWLEELRRRDRCSQFFSALVLWVVTARKP